MSARAQVRDAFIDLLADGPGLTDVGMMVTARGFEMAWPAGFLVDVRLDPGKPWTVSVDPLEGGEARTGQVPTTGTSQEVARALMDRIVALAAAGSAKAAS